MRWCGRRTNVVRFGRRASAWPIQIGPRAHKKVFRFVFPNRFMLIGDSRSRPRDMALDHSVCYLGLAAGGPGGETRFLISPRTSSGFHSLPRYNLNTLPSALMIAVRIE